MFVYSEGCFYVECVVWFGEWKCFELICGRIFIVLGWISM